MGKLPRPYVRVEVYLPRDLASLVAEIAAAEGSRLSDLLRSWVRERTREHVLRRAAVPPPKK